MTGLIGAVAILAAGCGESRHDNDQRPQVSTRVSVTISSKEVIVQPLKVAMGPERLQEIPQNQAHPEPPFRRKGPLDVVFVVANQTTRDTTVQVLKGPQALKHKKVFAHSPGTFQVNLPAGSYTITAGGLPDARPARLTVGSYRASSQNDVLLP